MGPNREILKDAKKAGCVKPLIDIRYFGRETKPVHKLLQFSNDPIIPGITGRESACINFLQELGIRMQDGDNWRRWIDLHKDEKRLIISNIAELLLSKGFGHKITKKMLYVR